MIYLFIINDNIIIHGKRQNMLYLERQADSPDKRSPVTLASGKGEGPRETAGRSFTPKQSRKRK